MGSSPLSPLSRETDSHPFRAARAAWHGEQLPNAWFVVLLADPG
jgi:hypothetical protein